MHFIKKEIDFKNNKNSADQSTGIYTGNLNGGCKVAGKVWNIKKQPVENAFIQLGKIGETSPERYINLKAKSDGSYLISDIEEGLYNIIVFSEDYEPELIENYKLEKNISLIELNFTLTEEKEK